MHKPSLSPTWLDLLRARPEPPMPERLHVQIARASWERQSGSDRAARLVARVGWPFVAAVQSARFTLRHGDRFEELTGRSRSRAFFEQLRMALAFSVPPANYWKFRLWDDAHRAHVADYLHRFETKPHGVYQLLRRGGLKNVLANKRMFRDHCREHGLPSPRLMLQALGGAIEWLDGTALPAADLFVKRRCGRGGAGAAVWTYRGDGRWRRDGTDDDRDAGELLAELAHASSRRGFILQERLTNHPELADLSTGALTTARVVTCVDERNRPEAVCAVFRMAVGSHVVDNFHAGGIAAAIDLATGTLGRATALRSSSPWHDAHPTLGARITGRTLPLWSDVLDLARRAHASLPRFIAVGWDVGMTPNGAVLVEGNGSPDLDIIQRTHDLGVASTRLGELLSFHLARREARRARRK